MDAWMQMPNPPPQTLTPQPLPLSTAHIENSGEIVPANFQHEHDDQKEKQKTNEGSKGASIDEFVADVNNKYNTLGQAIAIITSALKRSNEIEVTLRAQIEVQKEQISELEGEVELLKNDLEEQKGKTEKEVREAKSEESIWRNKFVELNDQLIAATSKSVTDKNTIKCLGETMNSFEVKVKDLEGKIVKFETSEKEFKKELEDLESIIAGLKTKMNENEVKIKQKDDKLVNLETKKRIINELLEDEKKKNQLLNTNLKKTDQQLETEKTEKQGVVLQLENKNKRIIELEVEKQSLVDENEEFRTTAYKSLKEQLKAKLLLEKSAKGRKRTLTSSSSDSSGKIFFTESISSSSYIGVQEDKVNVVVNEAQQLESNNDVPQTATLCEKRKSPATESSTACKNEKSSPTDYDFPTKVIIRLQRIVQKSKVKDGEDDGGMMEVCSSSRESNSPPPSKKVRQGNYETKEIANR